MPRSRLWLTGKENTKVSIFLYEHECKIPVGFSPQYGVSFDTTPNGITFTQLTGLAKTFCVALKARMS